jgi:hypothetical protein
MRALEVGGATVVAGPPWRLTLPPITRGYADAQLDDYGGRRRNAYPWRPRSGFSLKARFSHPTGALRGTAGFGFWNAPFGDPRARLPALPQAAWFFHASSPTDLALPLEDPGRGWFASTVYVPLGRGLLLAPLALPVMLLNRLRPLRRRIWPRLRRAFGISFAPLDVDLRDWHHYALDWRPDGCRFTVDGRAVLETPHSPRGPLGFVCWLDNQYLVATPDGKLRWGTLPTSVDQWLEVSELLVPGPNSPDIRSGPETAA